MLKNLEFLFGLPAPAIVLTPEEIEKFVELKAKGFFSDVKVIQSDYDLQVALKCGAMKLVVRDSVFERNRKLLVQHYYVVV